jgi:hypothetical protein
MYKYKTGTENCHKHLYSKKHMAIYDKTVLEKNWPYPLSTDNPDNKTTVGELRKRVLPRFTLETFIEYLICFIIANDQVSNLFLSLTHVLTFS